MNYKRLIIFFLVLALAGCSSLLRREAPSIAHVHIGHSLTGWRDTPGKKGLLVVAEQESAIVLANAELASNAIQNNPKKVQQYLEAIAATVDPVMYDSRGKKIYGLMRGVSHGISHLGYAMESSDASTNVLRTVAKTNLKAEGILVRVEELQAFVEEALNETDTEIRTVYLSEILRLSHDIIGGDGKSDASIYGLTEYRNDIEAMVARENPPYTTVDTWFLLNLVRLQDGSWAFKQRNNYETSSGY